MVALVFDAESGGEGCSPREVPSSSTEVTQPTLCIRLSTHQSPSGGNPCPAASWHPSPESSRIDPAGLTDSIYVTEVGRFDALGDKAMGITTG